MNPIDWELAFGRANTFTGSLGRRRRRRRRSERGPSRPNSILSVPCAVSVVSVPSAVSVVSVPSAFSLTSQSSSKSRKKASKGGVSSLSKRKGKKRYNKKSERSGLESSAERITSPISYKNNPLPSIPRIKSGQVSRARENKEKGRVKGGKKIVEKKKEGEEGKGEENKGRKISGLKAGGSTYRVIPMSDINRLAEERKTSVKVNNRGSRGVIYK